MVANARLATACLVVPPFFLKACMKEKPKNIIIDDTIGVFSLFVWLQMMVVDLERFQRNQVERHVK
jgi:hypothetical protein